MDVNRVLDQVNEFPTLPTIYSALLDVIANPRSTVADVAKIIERDQSSAVKILKAVNSSVYGLQVKVTTISQAIFHLGFNEIKNLVITLSLVKIFSGINSVNSFNIVDFWKHSIAVGVITRLIGSVRGEKNIEDYFVSGIIHDIGKLFFLKFFPKEYSEAVDDAFNKDITIRQSESGKFNATHNMVGDVIAKKWKLPVGIRNVITSHFSGMVNGKCESLVATVHLANIISKIMKLGASGDKLVQQPNIQMWEALNLPANSIMSMMPRILSDYNQSASILSLK
ncbi:MAG: hypothetical protein QG635_276 [Bacteroidota bacterium]|nr:hypothetical protein [Bacteroidota bacterium]